MGLSSLHLVLPGTIAAPQMGRYSPIENPRSSLHGLWAPGTSFGADPTVDLSGNGRALTLVGQLGTVARPIVTAGGSGYTSAPAVTITGGGGSGATAQALLTNGVVTSLNIVTYGSGYTSDPVVSFSGGGGSGATATLSYARRDASSALLSNVTHYDTGIVGDTLAAINGGFTLFAVARVLANPVAAQVNFLMANTGTSFSGRGAALYVNSKPSDGYDYVAITADGSVVAAAQDMTTDAAEPTVWTFVASVHTPTAATVYDRRSGAAARSALVAKANGALGGTGTFRLGANTSGTTSPAQRNSAPRVALGGIFNQPLTIAELDAVFASTVDVMATMGITL